MNKIAEFITKGSVTFEKVDSKVNGELTVKWDTIDGYHILGGGLWQVGGPVVTVWNTAFKNLPDDFNPKTILILGLGGGSIASLARKKWINTNITGVDLDPVIVELGKKYLGLDKQNVEIKIQDAYSFVQNSQETFDLVCVDLYLGENFPDKFESEDFLKLLSGSINKTGIILVNRLYFGKHRSKVDKFEKVALKYLDIKKRIYPKITENLVLHFEAKV